MYKNYMGNSKSPETETDKATAEPEAEAAELVEFFSDCVVRAIISVSSYRVVVILPARVQVRYSAGSVGSLQRGFEQVGFVSPSFSLFIFVHFCALSSEKLKVASELRCSGVLRFFRFLAGSRPLVLILRVARSLCLSFCRVWKRDASKLI